MTDESIDVALNSCLGLQWGVYFSLCDGPGCVSLLFDIYLTFLLQRPLLNTFIDVRTLDRRNCPL